MSKIYDDNHLKMQLEFESEKLASAVENIIVHEEVMDDEKAFDPLHA